MTDMDEIMAKLPPAALRPPGPLPSQLPPSRRGMVVPDAFETDNEPDIEDWFQGISKSTPPAVAEQIKFPSVLGGSYSFNDDVPQAFKIAQSAGGMMGSVLALRNAMKNGSGTNKLMAAITFVNAGFETYGRGREIYRAIKNWREERTAPDRWHLVIKSDSDLYALALSTLHDLRVDDDDSRIRDWILSENNDNELITEHNVDRPFTAYIDGHEVVFRNSKKEPDHLKGAGGSDYDEYEMAPGYRNGWSTIHELHVYLRSAEGFAAFQTKMQEILNAQKRASRRPPEIYVFSSWGWDRTSTPLRPLRTVVLDAGLKDSIITDVQRFLDSEMDYVVRGIPWHRGLMFYGPPGTGKTSLAKALAEHFGIDTFFLTLDSIKSDQQLFERVRDIKQKSILVLEDIDSTFAANDRNTRGSSDKETGISSQALLSVLDGPHTPHGTIIILTTNYPDHLDPAIVRPGRVDLKIKLDWCTSAQANELYRTFYEREPKKTFTIAEGVEVSTADVTELFKQRLYEPEDAESALHALLSDGKRTDAS